MVERKGGITNFDHLHGLALEYNLGAKVSSMLVEKGHGLIEKIKPIIVKKATDENGDFLRNWKDMTSIGKLRVGSQRVKPQQICLTRSRKTLIWLSFR